ncbi:adenylate/guanylate cyclase domain-containing protein [Bradyrhizobium sp. U87765 SZCCT0131]|uniref:adenylate/guanylate cyclase domain-containing protein n=1 Tax=unclassified Bradyrhizobium TaxID=2631580 RepID=UPI001BADF80D|nr:MULTISPECIES: adenylate/guanylate cyclase domain-containing protein [unclassified Bradyrhizobium]MBR1222880.1 adenylate/guanylate cyclase domain-containing protein [Bradyrhizobium sp. U87765 SZCCT0131]MBR1262616.1 adenylate/guanylate cyclase domain-containing protein [Bradyrhizobium sp. U87765 SZCCT0134]MBR1308912.1 adenylate/guanylate cyclase domain-containing protein [Bradyrhizobium sp. U87765 SZCCT0110]MBR1318398.1 adenylate/guanylate cyclase domain-containing protein [Bradyrhizobium sp. 
MRWPWSRDGGEQPAISADFRQELTRQILGTELIRIRALVATVTVLTATLWGAYTFAPAHLERLWRGHLDPSYLYFIVAPFVAFELVVHVMIRRRIALGRDVPVVRRYFSAFIETSLPTVALAVHIDNMGSVQALGFVAPLAYFIFIILSTLRLDFWLSTFTGAVAATELFAMAAWYHPDSPPDLVYHGARGLILLLCGVLAGAVGVQLRRQFEASIAAATARDRVANLFGQHVSPQVVERLLAEGTRTDSDVRRVVVMFVDFRSFTAQARQRTPQQVVARLDGAFAVLVEILDRHGGIVNKFLGDGFLALFGAPFETPDAARHAVDAAREMLAAMERDNAASDWPLRIGIGLHVGEVVAGTVGSPRRKEYTVIGDTVNLAARLEALNKQFGSQVLVSAGIHDALGPALADARPLGEVAVRGYDRPLAVWQLG